LSKISSIDKEIESNGYSALILQVLIPNHLWGEFIKDFGNKFLMKKVALPEKRARKVFPKAILADGIAVAGSSQCDPTHEQVVLKMVNNF